MSEASAVAATARPNTARSIAGELAALGLAPGDAVLVHSSLSSLGWVCGGAQAVIQALTAAVGEGGTVAMPAHTGGNSDPAQWNHPPVPPEWFQAIYENMPAFDAARTPTRGMGQVAELFRTQPGVLRSHHPHASFTAWGGRAAEVVARHDLTPQLGMGSPLGALYALGARVLLLGVGYGNCTCLHLAETLCPPMPVARTGAAMMENGARVWRWFDDFDYDSDRDFEDIGAAFEATGAVRAGAVGNARCRLFSLPAAVDFARSWLMEHRFGGGR